MIHLAQDVFNKHYLYIENTREDWKPDATKNLDMEVLNHIFRVIIQNHDTEQYIPEFMALIDVQHEDGGWGNYTDEIESHVRVTAFSTQMLLRFNSSFEDRFPQADSAIEKGINYLLRNQKPDGTWYDVNWGLYDAISVSTGTLMFAEILPSVPESIKAIVGEPFRRGIEFVVSTQGEDGGWVYKEKYETPVCVTAHLLQKTLGYEHGVAASQKAINYLINSQDPEGHYDGTNIDHTCDSIRALMLASELLNDFSANETIEKGIRWLFDNRNDDDGWGDFAGDESNFLINCDGMDTMLKYIRYVKVRETCLASLQ
ncbi:prenyltransferase/squalene oxidase repeat-containing protein [Paenibacillus glacialis]|uniref:Squalene cyclase C-terminal domain-containing protein n=1 Tax=Paenibacillus glacialis TaxID=494026 RepID=A0A168D0W2_9BACL|nr:prenyltransferase/squalene oxidase repeat-containing protein [Paenibacillus glacialis]OAB33779.1 hypothetical protein PGLA_22865 [Paenibacillus glacialis]